METLNKPRMTKEQSAERQETIKRLVKLGVVDTYKQADAFYAVDKSYPLIDNPLLLQLREELKADIVK